MAKTGKGSYKRYKNRKAKQALTKAQAKAVAKIAKKVDASNEETKSVRSNYMNTVSGLNYGGWYHNCLDQITVGTASNQRIGNKIHVSGIDVRLTIERSGMAAASDMFFRVTVIDHTDPYYTRSSIAANYWSSLPAVDHFYDTAVTPVGRIKNEKAPKFRVLKDKVIKAPKVYGGVNDILSTPVNMFVPINRDYIYDGATTQSKPLILFSWYHPSSSVSISGCSMFHNVKIYYKDA